MIRLRCLHGQSEDQTFEFDDGIVTLGRSPECDLRVDDGACSRLHARIERSGSTYRVRDMGSTNGIMVNGQKVGNAELKYGDRLSLGRHVFIFLTELPEASISISTSEEGPHIQKALTSQEAENHLQKLSRLDESDGDASEVRKRNRHIHILYRLSLAISKTLDSKDLCACLANSIIENFEDCERVSIYLVEKDGEQLKEAKYLTHSSRNAKAPKPFPVSRSILERVRQEKVALLATDASVDNRFAQSESISMSNLRSLMCVPLTNQDRFLGAIYVENCTRASCFSQEDLELLSVIGNQAAAAFRNCSLYEEIQVSFYDTVRSLSNAIEAKDKYTRGHSARVAHYAVGMGRELGLSTQRIALLKIAAELHDIGKIAIAEEIISKADKLTEEEFEVVKQHPRLGVEILEPIRFLKPVLPFILYHHERCNGEGYPEGLTKADIPLEARILNLADAFDAMTTKRPYNDPVSRPDALLQCRKEAGVSFDDECVRALENFLKKKATRTIVAPQLVEHELSES